MFIRILLLLVSQNLWPAATSFGSLLPRARGPRNFPHNTLLSLRGGEEAASDADSTEAPSCVGKDEDDDNAFPVVSRFVGGTWKNTYGIFHGIGFDRGENRVRYTEWTLNHHTGECEISLRAEEAPEGSPPIVLKGKHIGNGTIRFGGFGDYEYIFRQVGRDTILVSRTEGSSSNAEDGSSSSNSEATRLDFGSMVLTAENSCVQTIAHTENGDLSVLEVIRGTREN